MNSWFQRLSAWSLVLALIVGGPSLSRAEPLSEFIKACTYGVLAGTLVGAASLAFTKKPGDNLKNIARGASLGLYAGIALGAYVIYFVPSQGMSPYEEPLEDPEEYEEEEVLEEARSQVPFPKVAFFPILSDQMSIEGIGAHWVALEF